MKSKKFVQVGTIEHGFYTDWNHVNVTRTETVVASGSTKKELAIDVVRITANNTNAHPRHVRMDTVTTISWGPRYKQLKKDKK